MENENQLLKEQVEMLKKTIEVQEQLIASLRASAQSVYYYNLPYNLAPAVYPMCSHVYEQTTTGLRCSKCGDMGLSGTIIYTDNGGGGGSGTIGIK